MIQVRPVCPLDKPELEALFLAQAFEYQAPDWLKLEVGAVVVRDGRISSAGFLRKTAETYFLTDPGARKRDIAGDALILLKEMQKPARLAGFTDHHCWIPPHLEAQGFGKVLLHMGWTKPLWPSYSRQVK